MTNHTLISSSPCAIIDIVVGGFIFCLGGLLVKYLEMSGISVAFWRMLIASCVLFLLTLGASSVTLSTRERLFGGLSGFFLALDLMLWHESVYAIGPGIATVINNIQVFFGAFLGIWLFKERLTLRMVVCLIVAIAGVVMISSPEITAHTPDVLAPDGETNKNQGAYGVITGVLSALMYALALMSLKPLNEQKTKSDVETVSAKHRFLRLAKIMREGAIAGTVTCGLAALLFDQSLRVPSVESVALLVVYGSVIHVLGWALITRSLPLLPIALTGLILMTEPIITVLLDMAIYAKSVTVLQWIGIVVTLTGVYFGSISRKST